MALTALPGPSAGQVPPRGPPAAPDTLTLPELATAALARHPAAAAARAARESALARVEVARAAYLPQAHLGATAVRYEEPMVVAPLHGFDPLDPPLFDRALYQGQAVVSYSVFDGGARAARSEAAAAGAEIADAAVRAAEAELLRATALAYFEVVTGRRLLQAHERRVAAVRAERERAAQLLAAGRSPRVQLLRAEATLTDAEAEAAATAVDVERAGHALSRLTGVSAERIAAAHLPALGELPAPTGAEREAALEAAGLGPEAARARAEAAAAGARVAEARAALLPRVAAEGRYLAFGAGDAAPVGEWNAGVQVSYPLFTGGARGDAIAAARADADAADARARDVDLRLADAVDRALAAQEAAAGRARALRDVVAQLEEVARIEALALEVGAGVQTDYLAAEAALLEARAGLARARAAAAAARVQVAAITGGLTPGWLAGLPTGVEP